MSIDPCRAQRAYFFFLIYLSEGEAEHVLQNYKMILQKFLKGYTNGRAKLLILSNFLSSLLPFPVAITSSDHFLIRKSTFCGVLLEKSSFDKVSLDSRGDGLSLPEKPPWLQFPCVLQGGLSNLYSDRFYPLRKCYVSGQQENLHRKPDNLL